MIALAINKCYHHSRHNYTQPYLILSGPDGIRTHVQNISIKISTCLSDFYLFYSDCTLVVQHPP